MPRLPLPEITVAPQQGYQGRNATAASFGADIRGLAQGVDQLSSAMAERDQKQQAFNTQRDLAEAGSDWMTQMQDRQQQAPLGAPDFTKNVLGDFDKYTQKMLDDRREQGWSADALNGLETRMLGLRNGLQSQAMNFEAQSRGAKVRSDTETSLTNFSQMASAAPGSLAAVEDQWNQMADALPLDAIQRDKLKQDGQATIRQAAGMGLAEKDPQAVIGALTGSDPVGGPRASYYAAIRAAESGGSDTAKNPSSSALGRYQFTEGTWAGLMQRHPQLGLTANGRTDPAQQEVAIRVFTEENADALSAAGVQPNNANLYAAHVLGAGGATAVLKAPPNALLSAYVPSSAIEANPFMKGMTVEQFKLWTQGKVNAAPPTPVDGKTGNPVLDALDAKSRDAVLARAYTFQNRQDAELRADLGQRVDNASAALLQTGEYGGQMPTQTDFVKAYASDPTQGAIEWAKFEATQRVGQNIAAFKTLPIDEINRRVAALEPTDTASPTYATDLKGYDAAQKAAAEIVRQRTEDPAGYIRRTFPAVEDAAAAFDSATEPQQRQDAMQTLLARENAAYDQMGVPPAQRALLPTQQAKAVLATFGDTNQSFDQRIAAPLAVVLSTPDPQQQKQVFEQLVRADNSFGKYQAAFEAWNRGDTGAARRLFQAGMTDPDKLAGSLPGGVKPQDISDKIAQKVFAFGQIGDATYGFSANVTGSQQRAQRDSALMTDAVKYQLLAQGDGDIDRAIDQVTRDIYGPVKSVNAPGVFAVVPENTDASTFAAGTQALRQRLTDAVMGLVPAAPADAKPEQRGAIAVQRQMLALTAQDVLDRGEWHSVGDGRYGFIDTASGLLVPGPDGKPLTYGLDEIMAAGATYEPPQPPGDNLLPRNSNPFAPPLPP